MNFRRHIALGLGLLLLISCNKKQILDGPNGYTDDFEAYSTADDLIPDGDVLWSFIQIQNDNNRVEIDTTNPHTGQKCLKFIAEVSTEDQLSKCSIVKQNMAFWEGETVRVDCWYYIEGTAEADWIFLMDLEEQAPIGAGPGTRLALQNENELIVEHKYPNPNINTFLDPAVKFPRDQWVNLTMEVMLSQKKKGTIRVWQDDELVLSRDDWRTLPRDILHAQQGTAGRYSSIEIGISANTHDNDMVLYVDDFSIEVLE